LPIFDESDPGRSNDGGGEQLTLRFLVNRLSLQVQPGRSCGRPIRDFARNIFSSSGKLLYEATIVT
jgi:hypothetical protein